MSEPTHAGGPAPLRSDDPLARKVTQVIRSGTAAELQQLLHEHPALVRARLGDGRGHARTGSGPIELAFGSKRRGPRAQIGRVSSGVPPRHASGSGKS